MLAIFYGDAFLWSATWDFWSSFYSSWCLKVTNTPPITPNPSTVHEHLLSIRLCQAQEWCPSCANLRGEKSKSSRSLLSTVRSLDQSIGLNPGKMSAVQTLRPAPLFQILHFN